jgi:hypothetical protein
LNSFKKIEPIESGLPNNGYNFQIDAVSMETKLLEPYNRCKESPYNQMNFIDECSGEGESTIFQRESKNYGVRVQCLSMPSTSLDTITKTLDDAYDKAHPDNTWKIIGATFGTALSFCAFMGIASTCSSKNSQSGNNPNANTQTNEGTPYTALPGDAQITTAT